MHNNDLRLKQIIEYLLDAANDADKEERNDIIIGEMLAYSEALKIIQEQLTEEEERDYGLDFDIDKKYL